MEIFSLRVILTTPKRCNLFPFMENQPWLIGTSDFDEVLEENALVVDKSLFIKEFMEDPFKVSAILRPRRFGKSLNLSMLKSFLSIGAVSSHFERFLISNDKEFVDEHCGQYPVVFVDLKDCKGDTWEEMYGEIWGGVCTMVHRHCEEIDSEIQRRKSYGIDFENPIPYAVVDVVVNTLSWLIDSLYQKHGKRVIVLVDEYDAPLNHAFRKGYYDQASSFFQSFYSQALKGNSALKRACLMGIVEYRGAGILSGLNNINVYSVDYERYSKYFGFSRNEMESVLSPLGKSASLEMVLNWYDGYIIGSQTMASPWSFLKWLDFGIFDAYWVQTSFTETLASIIRPSLTTNLIVMISILLNQQVLFISPLSTQVDYKNEEWDPDSVMHFFVLTGYLAYRKPHGADYGQVWIPNLEIASVWNSDIMKLLNEKFGPIYRDKLIDIFTAEEFNPAALQEVMQSMLLHCSSHDLNSRYDNSYHMLFYGIFLGAFYGKPIRVLSNRESGHGRFDVRIESDTQLCFIFVFKLSRSENNLDGDAQIGLDQIIRNNYAAESLEKGYKCIGVGIACHKRKISQLKSQFLI